ncbi:MAG: hypothetical protein NW237_00365 [Cyanobacteriota bacterium]|nr:hypothetical protein [Cyanobacteriota bacterium]
MSRGWAYLLGGLVLSACGGETNTLAPVDLALLLPDNFTVEGSLTTGSPSTFIEFDVRRSRDDVLITEPLTVYIRSLGLPEDADALTDLLGNRVYEPRAVAFLGNGIDSDGEGTPEPPPTSPPQVLAGPLLPYSTENWQSRAVLGYIPGQTNIPARAASNRFGIYVSSLLAFEGVLQFSSRDQLGSFYPQDFTLTYQPGSLQTVTVTASNASGSADQPLVVAICNQLNAAILVGITSGNQTQIQVPAVSTAVSSLSSPTAYVTEAYQFDGGGSLLRVSQGTGGLSVPLLDSSQPSGNASLNLVDSSDGSVVTCFGDPVADLRTILSDLF